MFKMNKEQPGRPGGENRPEIVEESLRNKIDESHDFVVRIKTVIDVKKNELVGSDLGVAIENKEGGVVLDFKNLLGENAPGDQKNIVFVRGKEFSFTWTVDLDKPVIELPLEILRDPREIFGLLHEIGHLRVEQKGKVENIDALDGIYEMLEGGKEGDLKDADLQILLQNERDAWAEALKIAKGIKKDRGLNLFSLFDNVYDLMGWLRASGLRDYEEMLEKRGIKAFTKTDKAALWENIPIKNFFGEED